MITRKNKRNFVKNKHNLYEKLKRALRFNGHHQNSNPDNMYGCIFKRYMYVASVMIYL